jgi:UDP-N-acetyl-D-glucosamine dehydrogenase
MGAIVNYYDPLVPSIYIDGKKMISLDANMVYYHKFACGIILSNHNIIDYDLVKNSCSVIVDTRNVFEKSEKVFKF